MFNFQHPRALPYLCLTEMWERFGFYVVQGMLVLYMSKGFHFSDDDSYTIMGAFWALAYIAPFAGGSLADRLLGFKTATIFGGILLCTGYAMLAMPWSKGFYLSLATIILGNGLLKPSISSLLGSLYEHGNPNRESGFTIFYMGINFGALLAGVSSGYIKNHFGWHAGFALASIGLVIGLATFTYGLKHLSELQNHSTFDEVPPLSIAEKLAILVGCIVVIFLISLLLQNHTLAKWLLPCAGIFLLIFLFVLTYRQETENRRRLVTLNALIISSVVFWMVYMQMFFSYSLFIDRLIKKDWGNIHIPTTAFYALENLFVVLLGPFFAWSWHRLNQNKRNPSSFSKFILAIAFGGLGSLIMGFSTYFPNSEMLINPLWILVAYFMITVGEMLLSPIGLSAVTTLSPKHLVGMMMGVWFVALGFGGEFAGWIAKLSNIPQGMTDPGSQLAIYRYAFLNYAYMAFGVALILYIMQLIIKRIYKS